MKKHHHSQHSARRFRRRRARLHYEAPREETPFSKPSRLSIVKRRLRLMDAVYLVITVVFGSALLGLSGNALRDYWWMRGRVKTSSVQLKDLQGREAELHLRLAALNSPEGRDQLLRERGFVQGKERILLFADDAQPAEADDSITPDPTTSATPVPTAAANKPANNTETATPAHTSFLGGVVHAIDKAADRPVSGAASSPPAATH